MPHDKDRIGQRAGFIAKATDHMNRHRENASTARQEGRDRAAIHQEARADTYAKRIKESAENIASKVRGK